MNNKKNCLILLVFSLMLMLPMAGYSLEIHDLFGYWNWQIPNYNEGQLLIDHTILIQEDEAGITYTIMSDEMDEFGYTETIECGIASIENNLLVLTTYDGNITKYHINISKVYDDAYELLRYTKHISQKLYLHMVRKKPYMTNRARNLNDNEKFQEAANAARLAIRYGYGENETAWFQLGYAYGYLGDYIECIRAYEQVLRINPDNQQADANLKWAEEQFEKYGTDDDLMK